MASWTNDSELAPVARGLIADLRDLVVSWRHFASDLREMADRTRNQPRADLAAFDRILGVRDAYLRCADELDRRIVLDDGEDG